MKIKLEIEVPEFEWVDTPTLYNTPIGEFLDIGHVRQIEALIGYLKRLKEIAWIIEANHQHVRAPFCRELIRNRLHFVPESRVWHLGEALSFFLGGFQARTGLDICDYQFKYDVLSNGKKIQFKDFSMMFDTEHQALQHIARIYTSGSDFKFEVAP